MQIFRTVLVSFMSILFFIVVLAAWLDAAERSAQGIPTRPDESCRILPEESWTTQEKWVWKQVCEGKIADFNSVIGYDGTLDPKEVKEWSEKAENRVLRPAFLVTIVLHEPYRGTLTRSGVSIVGAWFKEFIDLSNATLFNPLRLEKCRFESSVYLDSLQTLRTLSFKGSTFKGKVHMDALDAKSYLLMRGGAVFEKGVVLLGAKIGEQMDMSGSIFKGEVEMSTIEVADHLFMDNEAVFLNKVALRGAKIGGQLNMSGSTFKDKLNLDSIEVANSLFMRDQAVFEKDVVLRGAKIGGQLNMIGSTFKGKVVMDALGVKGYVLMRGAAVFENEVVLLGAKIGNQLDMSGSTFKGKLNLDSIEVASSLFMRDQAVFEKDVALRGAKIGGQLNMIGSTFKGNVVMDSLEVASSLFMKDQAVFEKDVVLRGAKIGGQLNMIGSTFKGKLNLDSLEVASSLFMRDQAVFEKDVVLRGAKIGGQLNMIGSTFKGNVVMDALGVKGYVLMRGAAVFEKEVVLLGAKIGNQLDMSGSTFKGKLNLDSLEVASSLFMSGSELKRPVSLIFAEIGRNLDISQSSLSSLDLTSSQIKGEFLLGSEFHPPPNWEKGAKLILRNTHAGALQDLQDAWPDEIEMVGFVYSQLGGFGAGDKYSMATRPDSWMIQWIKKQKSYSPQPYEQLASILIKAGYKDKGTKILYAGREEERSSAPKLNWIKLTLLKYIIGYGYYNFRAFYWVCGFIVIGWFFAWISERRKAKSLIWCLVYSLDMLLPIIELEKKNYEIPLSGLAKYYFYFHKLVGYVLASFLIAGFSGLTK